MLAMHTGFATGNALTERDYAFYEERAKGGAAAVTVLLAVNEAGALKGMYDAETVEKESLRTLAERVCSTADESKSQKTTSKSPCLRLLRWLRLFSGQSRRK